MVAKRMKQAFPRVILCHQCRVNAPDGPVFASAQLSIQAVSETFGPPDRYSDTERWVFVDADDNISCAMIARATDSSKPHKPLRIDFVAPPKLGNKFFQWTTGKINRTENGDLAPAFLVA